MPPCLLSAREAWATEAYVWSFSNFSGQIFQRKKGRGMMKGKDLIKLYQASCIYQPIEILWVPVCRHKPSL